MPHSKNFQDSPFSGESGGKSGRPGGRGDENGEGHDNGRNVVNGGRELGFVARATSWLLAKALLQRRFMCAIHARRINSYMSRRTSFIVHSRHEKTWGDWPFHELSMSFYRIYNCGSITKCYTVLTNFHQTYLWWSLVNKLIFTVFMRLRPAVWSLRLGWILRWLIRGWITFFVIIMSSVSIS